MIKKLPARAGRSFSILLATLMFLPISLFAQQENLKTEANDPNPVQTGHNNLRKLAKLYDRQAAKSQENPQPVGDDALLRRLYEFEMLKDPATGEIPEDIRERELAFAAQMNERYGNRSRKSSARVIDNWRARGPFNVGGRTRALALDLDDENIILAGGVSGGLWRSEDGGLSWRKTTGSSDVQSVTSVVQDPRPGFRNVWYYATGERIGNSASGAGAFFGGNGIYKSIDGGRTWNILPGTADNRPETNTPFDITFNLAIHPATGDLYAATWWGIRRSTDGGSSFTEVVGGGVDIFSDVMITPNGVIYATFDSRGNPNKGILRSLDGNTWTNITPAGFPNTGITTWGRTVLGYTPSNENIVYIYADNGLNNGGAYLWRYTHSDTTPAAVNLTAGLPAVTATAASLNTQGGYNMFIKIHPLNANVIFLGATNLYRSANGFTSRAGTAWIGGYSPANNFSVYPNQHPDHHALVFYPSNPLKALAATDGGLHYTDNIFASNTGTFPVLWLSRNNGYLTTQPYTVSLDLKSTNDQLLAGFQDNGSWFTNSGTLTSPWTEVFTGDGSYNAFADSGLTRYASSQNGNIYRFNYTSADDAGGAYVSFTRVTPAGATGFVFVSPFLLDPHNDNVMYMPVGGRIWRNDNLDAIPLFSNAPTAVNWNSLANTQVPTGNTITAIAISQRPANRLYYGTNRGLVYRVDNANIGDQPKIDIATGKGLPTGTITCITVDPANADRVFVVFSNYNINSIFYSDNGGQTWSNISGNLEETPTGVGSGPSVRWLAIEGNSDRYLVGTSTGLYAATTINGSSTSWAQEDINGIGNVVIPMVKTREDGFVAVASHGNGLYSAKFAVTPLPQQTLSIANPIDDFEVFVNSPQTIIDISKVFTSSTGNTISYSVINATPSLLTASLNGNLLTIAYTPNMQGKGSLGIVATSGDEQMSEPFNIFIRDLDYLLYQQNTPPVATRPSQQFTDFSNAIAQSADDFEVPQGQSWTIEKVAVPGVVNGAPVLNAAIVEFYSDTLGTPHRLIYSSGVVTPVAGTGSDLEVMLPTQPSLPQGKYWISVYARLAFAGGNQWFWRTTATVKGSQAHFKDAGNLFGRGALNWTPVATAFGTAAQDMLFTLWGKGSGIPAPATPTQLNATYNSTFKFDLTWTDNATTEIGYLIERSNDGNAFSRRTIVGPNVSSYSDTEIFDRNLTYYYRVAAIGISSNSAYSNIDSTAVIPDTPEATLATFVFPQFFIANWKPAIGARYYELDVSADNFSTFLTGFESKVVKGNSQLVIGTSPTASYQYRLRAGNAGGETENSNVITVATIKNLKFAAVCSEDPATSRRWKVTNPNPFPVETEWLLFNTTLKGTLLAPPGDSYFTTPTQRVFNTVILTWKDDKYLARIVVKNSSSKTCDAIAFDNTARSSTRTEEIETDSPFMMEAWPNPVTDKFNVLIASPSEIDVDVEIIGLKGERIHQAKVKSNVILEIDATRFAPGIYILKAQQPMFNKAIKLMKQ